MKKRISSSLLLLGCGLAYATQPGNLILSSPSDFVSTLSSTLKQGNAVF